MLRKNYAATGSFLPEDRGRAVDLLGFESQLMFNTFHNRRLRDWEHSGDLELAYGAARAHNRGMVEFCSADRRLLPTCYVPLVDFDRAAAMAEENVELGAERAADRQQLPARPFALAPLARPRVGRRPGRRPPGRVPRGRHRRPDRPGLLPQRPADPARLPRRRGELPLGRLHGDPVPADADARDDGVRRRLRPLPAAADRRDRAGRDLGAAAGCARWRARSRRS